MNLWYRNLKSCASCWNNMGPLVDCTVHLKVICAHSLLNQHMFHFRRESPTAETLLLDQIPWANPQLHVADPALRKQRKQKGGNTGKNFTEGWVEFEDKAVAKQVAAMLNGNPIGGKRRSAYHYDLWSLKYLPKFKWDHLTEEIGDECC